MTIMTRYAKPLATLAAVALLPLAMLAQRDPGKPSANGAVPPKTWVDKDTGHRVWRMTDEPNSGAFYFNVNGYTPDKKTLIYTAPNGIHGIDMTTHKTRLIVPNPPRSGATGDNRFSGGVH